MKTLTLGFYFLVLFQSLNASHASVPQRSHLMAQNSRDFSAWITRLSQSTDQSATLELMVLAKDTSLPEDRRYMAVMGVARKNMSRALPWLETLMSDKSFHVRSAALTSIAGLSRLDQSPPYLLRAVQKALQDPALWIRHHALALVQEFHLVGLRSDVEAMVKDTRNQVRGTPLPIIEKSKAVLETL